MERCSPGLTKRTHGTALKKPIEFINSIITSHDQDRIYQFLNQRLKSSSNKNLEKQISWTNETTKISYTLINRGGFARIKDKVRVNCFKNTLQVDLTNLYPVSLPNLKPNISNNYCHIPPNDWKMEYEIERKILQKFYTVIVKG